MKFKKVVELVAELVQKTRVPSDFMEMLVLREKELQGINDNIKFAVSDQGKVEIEFEEDKYITYVTFEKGIK